MDGEEAIELKRRGETLALAKAGTTGLYSMKISPPIGCAPSRQERAYAVTRFELQEAPGGLDPTLGLRQDHIPARFKRDLVPSTGSDLFFHEDMSYYSFMKTCHPDLRGNNPDSIDFCMLKMRFTRYWSRHSPIYQLR